MDAGKIAGIEVLRIINEPTAASLAYGLLTRQSTFRREAIIDQERIEPGRRRGSRRLPHVRARRR